MMPVCSYFVRGSCNRGSSCRFLHPTETNAVANAVMSSSVVKKVQPQSGDGTKGAVIKGKPMAASSKKKKGGKGGGGDRSSAASSSGAYALPAGASFSTDKPKPKVVGPKKAKRAFDPYVAAAIDRARAAQDMELRPWTAFSEGTRFYGIDVECVASGHGHAHGQRSPARVALVDGEGETVLDELVRPGDGEDVVSYLTPLTGLTAEQFADGGAKSLGQVTDLVRSHLAKDAVLVGQSVRHDIEWLGLKMGEDFADYVDIARLFRQRVPRNPKGASEVIRREMMGDSGGKDDDEKDKSDGDGASDESEEEKDASNGNGNGGRDGTAKPPDDDLVGFRTKYRLFSLRHTALVLLSVDVQSSTHDPAIDAKYSVVLFNKYRESGPPQLRAVRDSLHRAPPTPGFAAGMPVCDGVCMSREGYRVRRAGRTIWRWYTQIKRGEAAF